ncbi:hypothetical protein MMC25_008073 [Agyrium rufum]|nr:hypothetical protein [Agyrium rufum]
MDFIRSQRKKIPQLKPTNLSGGTVLITGGNAGLGKEAAREILASKPSKLILAVRNLASGNAAKSEISMAIGENADTTIEVRKLDQSSFESVHTFVKGLGNERIDIAILNAGVRNSQWSTTPDGFESDLQVNVLAPTLFPANPPMLTFVGSGLHEQAKFPERKEALGKVIAALNDPSSYKQQDRYATSKTVGLLWMQELAQRVSSDKIDEGTTINAVNPGFCKKGITQHMSGAMAYILKMTEYTLGRSPQDGARCIVDAAVYKGKD